MDDKEKRRLLRLILEEPESTLLPKKEVSEDTIDEVMELFGHEHPPYCEPSWHHARNMPGMS